MPIIKGQVIHGDQRGRELGFPTANIAIPETQVPHVANLEGVWAGSVTGDDGFIAAATISVGRRPTFYDEDGELLLEAYLLDFTGDLYGKILSVDLIEFIRGQLKFASVDELIAYMNSDVVQTRTIVEAQRDEHRFSVTAGVNI